MILVLGGTRFLGRHVVDALTAAGHSVTCLHRGKTMCALPPGATEVFGDRDDTLDAVAEQAWDAVIDVNGQEPAQLERSSRLRTGRYVFVSSVSAYRDLSRIGVSEDDPTIETFDPEDVVQRYGGNKAACERLVFERFGDGGLILRPGLIVGKWDYTGRFSYWPMRALRGGDVAVAAPPERPVQYIDGADVAAFVVRALETALSGTFNLVGPREAATMDDLLRACFDCAAARGAPRGRAHWIDPAVLAESGVNEWTEMPLWVNSSEYAGLVRVDNARAVAAGIEYRPVAQTIGDVMDSAPPAVDGIDLTPEREAAILAAAARSAT